ncbi:MAG: hypothetical protein QM751_10475 [Paludibacteraceae bacterium]
MKRKNLRWMNGGGGIHATFRSEKPFIGWPVWAFGCNIEDKKRRKANQGNELIVRK